MPETKYWKALNDALRLEMERDERVVVLGEDVAGGAGREGLGFADAWGGPFGITRGLIAQFGAERVRDTPISEAAFLGAAAGLALEGYRPWIDIMFQELTAVAWDQLTNRIARTRYLSAGQRAMPITIKTFGECYSATCHYPGLISVAPSDAFTAKGLMTAAIREDNPIVVFDSLRLLRQSMEVPSESYELPLGEARIVRDGCDLTLLGIGVATGLCMTAAEALAERDVSVEVVDLLTLMPWDVETVTASASKTGRLLIVDFDHPACSLSAEIAATVGMRAWSSLRAAPVRLSPPGVPAMLMDGTPAMASMYYPSVEGIVRKSEALLTLSAD
jgi:pyruvate/2-oxoglutarate/acetoin dehydrogenase E1 component